MNFTLFVQREEFFSGEGRNFGMLSFKAVAAEKVFCGAHFFGQLTKILS